MLVHCGYTSIDDRLPMAQFSFERRTFSHGKIYCMKRNGLEWISIGNVDEDVKLREELFWISRYICPTEQDRKQAVQELRFLRDEEWRSKASARAVSIDLCDGDARQQGKDTARRVECRLIQTDASLALNAFHWEESKWTVTSWYNLYLEGRWY